jgi:ankyrin repeat protein
MAKKKRKTLPSDCYEILRRGDIEEIKAVFDKCEITAYAGRCDLNTALHHYGIPAEIIPWLVEQGLDVNTLNSYGRTPLNFHAGNNAKVVKVLFELGGDVAKPDNYGNTPLHSAASGYVPDNVKLLVEQGVDLNARDNIWKRTPLEEALISCRGIDIGKCAKVAEILVDAGAEVTPAVKEYVRKIGEDVEFHRGSFHPDYVDEIDTGLAKLYKLFDVEPVKARKIHDGVSPIVVEGHTWKEQFAELWELLIPSHGAAETLQGEVVRIAGRVQDEMNRNGGCNWNRDYRMMLDDFVKHVATGVSLPEAELEEAKSLASSISPRGDFNEVSLDRLCELATKWVLLNPEPIKLETPRYKR